MFSWNLNVTGADLAADYSVYHKTLIQINYLLFDFKLLNELTSCKSE